MKHWKTALMLLLCLLATAEGCAQTLDAAHAGVWLEQFIQALSDISPEYEPVTDPARPGESLIGYGFGTVTTSGEGAAKAADIRQISAENAQMTDPMGHRVGDSAQDVLPDGKAPGVGALRLIETSESGYGWSWATVDAQDNVTGLESIAYGEEAGEWIEYALTYDISGGVIASIRFARRESSEEQAKSGAALAEEMIERRRSATLCFANDAPALGWDDFAAQGAKLGGTVAEWVAQLGEPTEIQTLPGAQGRLLLYPDGNLRLALDDATGEEIVKTMSCTGEGIKGPGGLRVGMTLSEAAACMRCDRDLFAPGTLYSDGARIGMLDRLAGGEYRLHYGCDDGKGWQGSAKILEISVIGGVVSSWFMDIEPVLQ